LSVLAALIDLAADWAMIKKFAFERAKGLGVSLPVVVCIGADIALQYSFDGGDREIGGSFLAFRYSENFR